MACEALLAARGVELGRHWVKVLNQEWENETAPKRGRKRKRKWRVGTLVAGVRFGRLRELPN